MDYSLYVVKLKFDSNSIKMKEEFENFSEKEKFSNFVYKIKNEENSYCILCIIDYLQVFDFGKNVENKSKLLLGSGKGKYSDISCVDPEQYSKRFINFMTDNFK